MAGLTKIATKGHGEDSEVVVELSFTHGSEEASILAAFLLEAKRGNATLNVTVETINIQRGFFDMAANATADIAEEIDSREPVEA